MLRRLPIFCAGSLIAPWGIVSDAFKRINQGIEVDFEAAGSAATVHKVTEENRQCGVLGSADYKLIPKLMFPDHADWYIVFGADQIVVCYTGKSKYAGEISASNWFQILQKDGVKFGHTDPDQDPAGYRALMVWQLAEKFYNILGTYQGLSSSPGNVMKAGPTDLVAMLKSGELDYAFEYSAVAARNNLKYLTLPDNINLSSMQHAGFYAQSSVNIRGNRPGELATIAGEPILYAVTVPRGFADEELAIKWVDFMLSDTGAALIEATGVKATRPRLSNDKSKVPHLLRAHLE